MILFTTLYRVTARDADFSATNRQIRYWLEEDESSPSPTFMVEEFTGIIRVLRALDTDVPHGTENHKLKVNVTPLSEYVCSNGFFIRRK